MKDVCQIEIELNKLESKGNEHSKPSTCSNKTGSLTSIMIWKMFRYRDKNSSAAPANPTQPINLDLFCVYSRTKIIS